MSYVARIKVPEARITVQGANFGRSGWIWQAGTSVHGGATGGLVFFFFDSIYYIYTLAKKISL